MDWQGNRESSNVEDRRGGSSGGGGLGGLLGGLLGGRRLGIGSIVIALVASYFLGVNPLTLLGLVDNVVPLQQSAPAQRPPADDAMAKFVSTTLASTEDIWRAQFKAHGAQYRDAKLVIYRGQTPTRCGQGQAAMGPFYCPADEKVYIDLDFYQTLKNQLGAPGEFAQAYVIAHEVAHHVQHLLGTSGKVDQMRGRVSEREQNALSVRLELQADCLAGVWAYHAKNQFKLKQEDLASALNAASKIGDDALQKRGQGVVRPESFTHGSSAQRVRWFSAGWQSGDIRRCDTFSTRDL